MLSSLTNIKLINDISESDQKAFFDFVAQPLSASQKHQLWKTLESDYLAENEDFEMAMFDVMTMLDVDKQLLIFYANQEIVDEIAWQTNMIAKTCGLTERFIWNYKTAKTGYVIWEGLCAFHNWLKPQGYRFAYWDDRTDSYAGLIVKDKELDILIKLAKKAGINISEFDNKKPF